MSRYIGHYMLIVEPNGGVTVYDESLEEDEDGNPAEHVFHGTMKEARASVFDALGEIDPEAETFERTAPPKPCSECPFRRKAAAGWLGASHPEGFVGTILAGREDLPCHKTIDYGREDWHERWTEKRDPDAKLCTGALVLQANLCKRPRSGPVMQPDPEHVFATYRDFVEHHRAAPTKSWKDPVDGPELDGINDVRELLKLKPLGEDTP